MQPNQIYDTIGDVFWWLFEDRHKYRTIIEQGGTWSGKTYSIMQMLGLIAITERNKTITVVGQDVPNLKRGALRDFEEIVARSPLLKRCITANNRSDRIYTFNTGSIIEFVSYLNAQDAQSGKRDYLFMNEANGIQYGIYQELEIRTDCNVFLDYNATAAFWVHDNLIGKPETVRHISSYINNPYVSPEVRASI